MTEYARAGGATTACEGAGSSPRPGSVRRPVLVVTGAPGPGRLQMTGGARRYPRGQVPGMVVPLMLGSSRSGAARAGLLRQPDGDQGSRDIPEAHGRVQRCDQAIDLQVRVSAALGRFCVCSDRAGVQEDQRQ